MCMKIAPLEKYNYTTRLVYRLMDVNQISSKLSYITL